MHVNDTQPPFMDGTFLWDEGGYAFKTQPEQDLFAQGIFASADPWLIVAASLELAKSGTPLPADVLFDLVERSDSGAIAQACLCLVGDAGRQQAMNRLASMCVNARESYVRVKACSAALHSGCLSIAPAILEAWQGIHPRERGALSLYLSYLLEDDFGPIASCEDFEADDDYAQTVKARIDELVSQHGKNAVIFKGKPADVRRLAEMMIELLDSGESDEIVGTEFIHLRHRFEAQTGIGCTAFYSRGRFIPYAARRILDQFLHDAHGDSFQPGHRYFFGHPL